MPLMAEYLDARRDEDVASLRRLHALRAMAAMGKSQREIAAELGVSQPAISQQLRTAPEAPLDPSGIVRVSVGEIDMCWSEVESGVADRRAVRLPLVDAHNVGPSNARPWSPAE
jgi:DNA-binding transcriptional regulator LsrR (DeoR family)